jgi:hypothetical protein
MSDAVKFAITRMVEDDLSRKDAAKAAGLTDDALRKAMQGNPQVRAFYVSAVRELLQCTKHHAVHVLRKEMTGPNAAARVAAARTLLGDDFAKPPPVTTPTQPGVTIVIEGGGPAVSHISGPLIDLSARPIESEG